MVYVNTSPIERCYVGNGSTTSTPRITFETSGADWTATTSGDTTIWKRGSTPVLTVKGTAEFVLHRDTYLDDTASSAANYAFFVGRTRGVESSNQVRIGSWPLDSSQFALIGENITLTAKTGDVNGTTQMCTFALGDNCSLLTDAVPPEGGGASGCRAFGLQGVGSGQVSSFFATRLGYSTDRIQATSAVPDNYQFGIPNHNTVVPTVSGIPAGTICGVNHATAATSGWYVYDGTSWKQLSFSTP